jgi:hypothetical protein
MCTTIELTSNLNERNGWKMKEDKRKEIRDCFLDYLKMYKEKRGFDDYSANQMAALGTRVDYKLSKNELIRILNNE